MRLGIPGFLLLNVSQKIGVPPSCMPQGFEPVGVGAGAAVVTANVALALAEPPAAVHVML